MNRGHAGHSHPGGAAGHGNGRAGQLAAPGASASAGASADAGWLTRALILIVAFMVGEVLVGLLAHSLALVSDAAHMLTDAASLVLALVTMRLAARPPKGGYTYGLKRAEILSAQANGITLLLLSAWLTFEAIRRLITPPQVAGGLVLVTALVGVAVNLGATWMVSRASRTSLNVEGAVRHIVTDLYAFIATAVAGVVIMTTGFTRADAIASLIVVVLMVRAGTGLVRESGGSSWKARPRGCARTISAGRWLPARTWPKSTTCTSGRSPPVCRPRRPTCSWHRAGTAMPSAPTSSNY